MMKSTRITRIVMHGFKSFAKRTELDFSETFNVVVGPNGSGKSNVLDALIFVLGKSGAKGMRAEKSANLIYNGGKKKTPATKAEVSIYFDNSSGVFPIREGELKITRVLNASGQSKYLMNDQVQTRTAVVEMLRAARINPDGYNVILQGDIVSFVEQSGIERRQVIEQIAGIDVYEEKKQKTMLELNKVDEKLKEAQILITEREAHLRELKKDRDQALKYRQLEENIHSYRATMLHRKNASALEEKRKLDERRAGIDSAIAKAKARIVDAKDAIGKERDRIDAITKEIERKGEKEQLALQHEIEERKVDIARKEARSTQLEQELDKLKERRVQLNAEIAETDRKIGEVSKLNESLINERSSKQGDLDSVREMVVKFKEKHKIKADSDIDARLDAIEHDAEQAQSSLIGIKEREQGLLREKDRIEYLIEGIARQREKVSLIEQEHKDEIEQIKKRKDLFKKHVQEIEKLLVKDASLASKSAQTRRKLADTSDERSKVESQLSSARAKVTASRAVETILRSKSQFKGVHGTVVELISAKQSSAALAIETAAGARLNSIVVDSDSTAKACIEHLRVQKVGSATFLPLNKIKASADRDLAIKHKGKDGVLGLARELVGYDAQYDTVMRYVFGDTLIVRSIDVAQKLGIGSARFITLDGDMIEASGAMTGGFMQKRQGGLSFAALQEKLDKLDEQVASLRSEAGAIDEERSRLEDELNAKKVAKADLEGEIIKSERSLHLASHDLDADAPKEGALRKDLVGIDKELSDLAKRSGEFMRTLTNAKIERQKLKDMVAQTKNPRVLAELSAFEQRERDLRDRIVAIDAELKASSGRVDEVYATEREKIVRILKQIDQDEKSFSKELEQLTKTITKDSEVLAKNVENASAFMEAFKELFKERNDASDRLREFESQRDAADSSMREQELKLNSLSLTIAQVNAQLASTQEELEQYANANILSEEEASTPQLQSRIHSFERLIADLGNVNLKALDIYDEVEKQYGQLLEKKASLEKELASIMGLMQEIEGKKRELFMNTFVVMNEKFKHFFSQLLSKGSAYLEVELPEDPFNGGVYIKVNLSGKKFLDIRSLSGGEKTMTALAFISAIQEHDPAPFYVLDEVDAALDKRNSEKLGEMIKKYCSRAQYVVISHNDVVISKADTIYGVSMDEHGISNMVGLKV